MTSEAYVVAHNEMHRNASNGHSTTMTAALFQPIPVLRIFDIAKAREYYVDYLGFSVDWEARFEPALPVYMQISRGPIVFHLTEHHGDACPGSTTYIRVDDIHALHAELAAKNYNYLRPGIETQEWGMHEMQLTDPFGNRIRFGQPVGS